MKYSSTIKITNSSDALKTMCLEPWAEEFEMLPEITLEIVAKSDHDGEFEIDFSETRITVYAWWGSVAEVFLEGENICGGGHIQLPGPKNGMSLSNSLRWLFGKE